MLLSERAWALNNHSLGRILTLVDATFSDLEQRKAFKDMCRSIFSEMGLSNVESIRGTCLELAVELGDKDYEECYCRNHPISTQLQNSVNFTYTRSSK